MALIDYDAIRTAAAMRSAQRAYDNLAEPEPTPAGVICEQIRLAEGELHNAWAAMQLDNADAARELIRGAIDELKLALGDE